MRSKTSHLLSSCWHLTHKRFRDINADPDSEKRSPPSFIVFLIKANVGADVNANSLRNFFGVESNGQVMELDPEICFVKLHCERRNIWSHFLQNKQALLKGPRTIFKDVFQVDLVKKLEHKGIVTKIFNSNSTTRTPYCSQCITHKSKFDQLVSD